MMAGRDCNVRVALPPTTLFELFSLISQGEVGSAYGRHGSG